MKRFILTVLALLTISAGAMAQDAKGWALGPRMNIYSNTGDGSILGIGAFARYSFTDHIRIEPAILALLQSGCSIDASLEVQYLWHIGQRWGLYPTVGVNASDMGKWAFGMNVGAGLDFKIAKSWDITAGVKWMPVFDSARRNPVVVSVGGCYRF